MSSIAAALQELDNVVSELEGSATAIEETIAGCQRDMFPGHDGEKSSGLTREVVEKKIDKAIEKVEGLLEEA